LHVLSTAGASILTGGLVLTLIYLSVALVRGPLASNTRGIAEATSGKLPRAAQAHFVEPPELKNGRILPLARVE